LKNAYVASDVQMISRDFPSPVFAFVST